MTLKELKQRCEACTRCPLYKTRTNLVFGKGPTNADVMLIGEAPGRNEDLQGYPFVGAAGHRLDTMLTDAGIDPSRVYIANVLKCRPPQNRDPQPEEIAACTPNLDDQIELVDPCVIVCLGRFATAHILGSAAEGKPMAALRGRVWKHHERFVVPVWHPAATIYDQTKAPQLAHDLSQIAKLTARVRADRAALPR